jgi:hypothetical protein
MKTLARRLHVEPYTSAIDHLEDMAQNSFPIKKGDKIAELDRIPPCFSTILEMEHDGKVIADYCNRVAIVIEKDKVVNLHNHVFKISGYKHDVVDEGDYRFMRSMIARETGTGDVDRVIGAMAAADIVAINGD